MGSNRLADAARQFCAAWGDGPGTIPDVDAMVELFAEDAEYVVSVPSGPTLKGRSAIRMELEHQQQFLSDVECTIVNLTASDSTVVTERLDHFTMAGKRISVSLAVIFEFSRDGKIVAWREYVDKASVAQQLGINLDDVNGIVSG